MLVYRICCEKEVDYILNYEAFYNIGNVNIVSSLNTHQYEPGLFYMHFFQNYKSILYMEPKYLKYVCIYDIPEEVLEKFKGYGMYYTYPYRETFAVAEYAIPCTQIKFSYLKKVERLLKNVTAEDFIDQSLDKMAFETIYDSSKIIVPKRKKGRTSHSS